MQKEQARAFIVSTIHDIVTREKPSMDISVQNDSKVFGQGGLLDSMQLVELMLALEDFCVTEGLEFNWNNDATFSEKRSVYRTVGTLADFIAEMSEAKDEKQ